MTQAKAGAKAKGATGATAASLRAEAPEFVPAWGADWWDEASGESAGWELKSSPNSMFQQK